MKLVSFAGALASLTFLVGCGGAGDQDAAGTPEAQRFVPVNVTVSEARLNAVASLSLAAAQSWSGSISGCLSGYSKTLDQTATAVNVMDADRNCVFKLSSLAFAGENFSFSGSESWSAGSVFEVTGDKSSKLTFQVISNLGSPISGAQSVSIVFSLQQQGTGQTVAANVESAINISGADPIDLDIATKAVSVDGVDGAGLFSFGMNCTGAASGSGASTACSGIVVNSLKFALVRDTFSGVLDLAQCRAVALAGASGTPQAAGGLATGVVKGPATLFAPANANLVFAIANPVANGGCKYFLISIAAP